MKIYLPIFLFVFSLIGRAGQSSFHCTVINQTGAMLSSQVSYNCNGNQSAFVFTDLANGATTSGTIPMYGTGGYPVTAYYYRMCNGDPFYSPITTHSFTEATETFSLTVYFLPDCATSQTNTPCTTNLTFTLKNNNPDWRIIGAGNNMVTAGQNSQLVAPGGVYTYSTTVPCEQAGEWHLWMNFLGSDGLVDTGLGGTGNTSTNSPSTSTPPPNTNVGNTTNWVTATPTKGTPQSNIIWSAGSSTGDSAGVANSVKDAASVAHDDAVKIGDQTHQDLGRIYTNTLGMTNIATETTQKGVSNILAGIAAMNSNFWGLASEFMTNSVSTNEFAGYMTNFPTLNTNFVEMTGVTNNPELEYFTYGFTNYDDAKAAAQAMSAETGLDVSENKLTEFLTGLVDFSSELYDYWPAVEMQFNFSPYVNGGALGRNTYASDYIIDFDPLHYDWGSEMFSLCRRLIMWLATFWFLMRIVEDAWKVVFLINNSSNIDRGSIRQYIREKK